MDPYPNKRSGIDGLTRKHVAQHASPHDPPHKAYVPVSKPHNAEPKLPHSSEPSQPFGSDRVLSHPSLPVAHARHAAKRTPIAHKLFVFPFTQRPDQRVLKLGLVRLALDLRFWLVIMSPILIIPALKLAQSSPAQLVVALRALLVAKNYVWFAVIAGGLTAASMLSTIVRVIATQAMMAIKIRSIDHRMSHAAVLIRNAASNILKSSLNWFVNSLLILLTISTGIGGLYLVNVSNQAWLVSWRGLISSVLLLLIGLVLCLLFVRRPLQCAMLATTQLPLRSIQQKSWRLVLTNLTLVGVASLFWVVISTTVLVGIITVVAGTLTFAPMAVGSLARVMVWAVGGLLGALIWLGAGLWQASYWSSLYHILVMRQPKEAISDFLVPAEPIRFRAWPMLLATALVLVSAGLYVAIVVSQRTTIARVTKQVKQSLPSELRRVVPAIENK